MRKILYSFLSVYASTEGRGGGGRKNSYFLHLFETVLWILNDFLQIRSRLFITFRIRIQTRSESKDRPTCKKLNNIRAALTKNLTTSKYTITYRLITVLSIKKGCRIRTGSGSGSRKVFYDPDPTSPKSSQSDQTRIHNSVLR
jgi:hypothetical protein